MTASIALGLYMFGLIVGFGVRSWQQYRATGGTGFRGLSGRPGSVPWWGGIALVLAVPVALAAAVLGVTGTLPGLALPAAAGPIGAGVWLAGFVLLVLSQRRLGESWRVGVEASERTTLVTSGVFAAVRNPIFTAMIAMQAGVAVMVPSAVSLAGLVLLLIGVQSQVRLVEEPYLRSTHGTDYVRYAAGAGRFLSWSGRLR